MDNPNPIRYSDLITPDDSITKLMAQLDELIAKYDAAKNKIQGSAAEIAKGLQGVSGASEEQRKSIQLATEQSEKLVAEYRDVTSAQWKATQAFAEAAAAKKESAQIDKLITQINTSVEGSYNKLSAQYRLNKIRLNEMSAEQRRTAGVGKEVEEETKRIYEEMSRLQKATGKYTLEVGHYERALGNLVGLNPRVVSALTDTKTAMASVNGMFKALAGPIGIIIGLLGGLVAAFKLFKSSIHETQVTGDAFDREMAGWTTTWEVFKKAVSTVDFSVFINNARDAARAGRELRDVLDEAVERANSTVLLRARIGIENQQLEEDMRDTRKTLDERLAAADKYIANVKPIYDQEIESAKRIRDAELNRLFETTKVQKNLSADERAAAKQRLADFIQNYNLNEELIDETKKYNDALKTIEKSRRGIVVIPEELSAANAIIRNASGAVKEYSDIVNQYGLTSDKQVKAYVEAETKYLNTQTAAYQENKRIVTMRNNLEAQVTKKTEDEAKEQQKLSEEAKKQRIALIQAEINAINLEISATDAGTDKMLELRLKKIEAERRLELERNSQMLESERQDEAAINAKYDKAVLDAKKQFNIEVSKLTVQRLQAEQQAIQLQIAVTEDGTEEMLNLRLANIEKQRQIEIESNKQLAEDLRQDEKAINAKYDAMRLKETADFNTKLAKRDLDALQERQAAEFSLLNKNERQKTIFRLQQEKARLLAILELDKTATEKMTTEEIAAIKATIAAIDKEAKKTPYNNLYELFGIGLDSDQQGALNTAIDTVKDAIGSIADSWNQAADAALESANAQVDAAQKVLDAEIEARNAGYANSVATAQKELELARSNQQKAQKEKEKAQKAQLAIDSITQASSLVTASANLWSTLSLVSPALAIAAIATMWTSFAYSKIKAAQVTKPVETYGSGTVELLQGGSHASGHDIDLGRKPDGTRRRAEGGEYFAVINKRNSRRYGHIIPDVINSFNNGTFADRYQRANAAMAGYAIGMIGGGNTDVSALERDVAAIRKQGDQSRFVDGQGNTVIRYKNLTRKIHKN